MRPPTETMSQARGDEPFSLMACHVGKTVGRAPMEADAHGYMTAS